MKTNAVDLAKLFIRYILAEHGPPTEIITDRAPLFMASFWKELTASWGTHLKYSTAYHPQTDGQTERVNSYLEQYLRAYVNLQQDNWNELLPMAQYHYNASYHKSIKMSPFEALKGYIPEYQPSAVQNLVNPSSAELMEKLLDLDNILEINLNKAVNYYKFYADKKRNKNPEWSVGNVVYLNAKNIKTTQKSKKLAPKFLGPFKILAKLGPVTYQLDLPKNLKIHNVFHVSLLVKERSKPLEHQKVKDVESIELEVHQKNPELILASKMHYGKMHYLVKWTSEPIENATWETAENILGLSLLDKNYSSTQLDSSV